MGNTWFTSDLHISHKNILKFCPDTRMGNDPNEMNEILVQEWNKVVRPEDTVYNLGDVSFNHDVALKIVPRLNGTQILITGNHDVKSLRFPAFRNMFKSIHSYYDLRIGSQNIVLFHFPILEWDRMHHGSWHLHGHTHGNLMNLPGKILDVGIDSIVNGRDKMRPYHFDEVQEYMKDRPVNNRSH